MFFKRMLLGSCLLLLPVSLTGGDKVEDPQWLHNYGKAMKLAKKTGKPILADFTGSDWCGYCKKLDRTVFSTGEFKKWAAENVILLEVDFPRRKRQSPGTMNQNRRLAIKYGVSGYPTLIFLDHKGKEFGRMGFMRGGAVPWLKEAQKIVDQAS